MVKSAMVEALIAHYTKGNKAAFAKRLGISPRALSMWLARGTLDINLVFTRCEGLNPYWLLTGEGVMLRSGEGSVIKATGGSIVQSGVGGNAVVSGAGVAASADNNTAQFLAALREGQAQLSRAQAQIDRLIGLLEKSKE